MRMMSINAGASRPYAVMAGLVPGIHANGTKDGDARHKALHDDPDRGAS